ncbi:MAG TPA: hypothetical protein DDY13_15630 [Cytophagales bacterium]|jgi:hypothetical protein|nr:hypothetical protein [Cytophagales bacterium]
MYIHIYKHIYIYFNTSIYLFIFKYIFKFIYIYTLFYLNIYLKLYASDLDFSLPVKIYFYLKKPVKQSLNVGQSLFSHGIF